MQPARYVFYFCCLLLISSCRKKDDYFLINTTGQVIDKTTMAPIPFAKVQLINATNGYSSNEVTADVNGYYSITFRSNDDNHLLGKAANYMWSEAAENAVPDLGSVRNFNIYLYPLQRLVITIRFADTTYDYMHIGFPTFWNHLGYPQRSFSRPADTIATMSFAVKGGTTCGFQTKVFKGNSYSEIMSGTPPYSAEFNYSVPCSATDTTFYSIAY